MSGKKPVISMRKNGREVQVDLHGYSTDTALWLALEVVESAWERGCERVVLIHGAKHVASRETADQVGQGGTKWALRDALTRGQFKRWAEPANSNKHDRKAVSDRLAIALMENPSPDRGAPWPEPPEHEYERTRRRD
ncbi:MAG: Smr/MutS family protein [marine benthic group bacterium]|nr:Smr/MutS family protein [Gemmatimonadota bacterium]